MHKMNTFYHTSHLAKDDPHFLKISPDRRFITPLITSIRDSLKVEAGSKTKGG